MLKNKNFAILGLSDKEEKIIETLKNLGPLRPTDLAQKTTVRRTTINFVLNKLQRQGLVKKIMVGGHYEWLLNEATDIRKSIRQLYGYFGSGVVKEMIQLSPDVGVEIAKGKKNILGAYKMALEVVHNDRIFAIQGNRSAIASASLESSYLNSIQREFKKRKVIIEGIVSESVLSYFRKLELDQLRIYADRMVVCHIVDDYIIDFDMDILIFKKMVIMINFDKDLVVIIRNENIYEVMLSWLEVLKLVGRKIDLNGFIRKLIEEKRRV